MRRTTASCAILMLTMGCVATGGPGSLLPRLSWSQRPAPPASSEPQHEALMERDGQGLAMTPTVYRQFYRLMHRGVLENKEPAACLPAGGFRIWETRDPDATGPGAENAFTRNVDVWALTVAETDSASDVAVFGTGPMCPDSLPTVHGHIWHGATASTIGDQSAIDAARAHQLHAPFNLVLYVIGAPDTFAVNLWWRQ